ncbi:MAG: hypothetical protein RL033_5912 [Pseudomonadota bacterium]
MTSRWCLLGLLSMAWACQEAPGPSATAVGGASGLKIARSSPSSEEAVRQRAESVEKSLNPQGLPLYSGPVGGVRGVVTVGGDPAPLVPGRASKIPETCPRALEFERKLFRQGVDRTLADVLVTVTEYQGYIKPQTDSVRVDVKGCAFGAKVMALVYGQRIDVFNHDPDGYLPRLIGVPTYTLRVAVPGGNPVPVFPPSPGQFLLAEETRDYMRGEVYVLSYPTFDVTALDGAFEINGVPAGDVKVTAYSPALGKVSEQRVKIQSGVTQELKFQLDFSQAEYEAALRKKVGATATSPAGQAGSAGAGGTGG